MSKKHKILDGGLNFVNYVLNVSPEPLMNISLQYTQLKFSDAESWSDI
jgi:hypothetical protein